MDHGSGYPCRYLIHSPLRRNEMKAIFTIVGSARSRHISPCIAADRDWITKKNQKAKHSMSNPARRRKLPGGVFFCRCASYSLCLPVCRIPMETHERRNTIETVFLRRRSNFHGNVYPPSEPSPYHQPTKKQRAQRSPANVHTSWRLMARYDSMQLVARGSLQHKLRWRNSL